jgi:hypothetical protein
MIELDILKKFSTDISSAVLSLRPNAQFLVRGNCYEGIEWLEKPVWEGGQKKPTKEEVDAEIIRLQREWDNTEYQRLRAAEYPPMADYLDGIVKNDQEQIQTYIDACLAVKAKYPKPEITEE